MTTRKKVEAKCSGNSIRVDELEKFLVKHINNSVDRLDSMEDTPHKHALGGGITQLYRVLDYVRKLEAKEVKDAEYERLVSQYD